MEEMLTGLTLHNKIKRRLSFSSNTDNSEREDLNTTCQVDKLGSVSDSFRSPAEISGRNFVQTTDECPKDSNVLEVSEQHFSSKQHRVGRGEDKENIPAPTNSPDKKKSPDKKMLQNSTVAAHENYGSKEESDADITSRNQEVCSVSVVFRGTVNLESCCRFVSEILKCVLYQRQQLPMTYDQLVYAQKQRQASVQDNEAVSWRPVQSADMDWRKRQRTLQEIDEVLKQLEELFCLSRVPRVLFLLGGSLIVPKEMYEINMESLVLACGDDCLPESSCLRQLFHTLFVADVLSDAKPIRLMPTTVLALAHRDCGVSWFLPKLHFKKPKRVKNQVIALSTDPGCCKEPRPEISEWKDYVWFQARVTIKGFSA